MLCNITWAICACIMKKIMLVENSCSRFTMSNFQKKNNRTIVSHVDEACAPTEEEYKPHIAVRMLHCIAKSLLGVWLTILFVCTVGGNVGPVLCVAGSQPAGVRYANTTCRVHTH